MDHQKSKSTFSAILLSLTLMVAAFWVSSAVGAEKKMVKDPSTGKMVSEPEYGGTITSVRLKDPEAIDPYLRYSAGNAISGVNERLGLPDWALDRDLYDYTTIYTPEFVIRGHLAESWEQPDQQTIIFHIRQGVHWHNKAPMNSRLLTAQDVEYNFHRMLGLGSGFTETSPSASLCSDLVSLPIESITATDKWTVVFKLKSISLAALNNILMSRCAFVLPPEVVKQYGDYADWRNVVGTGPFMLTDWVDGSSLTYTKNPDYWGYDEKYPENRLPYIDELRFLISVDKATHLALLRSGKADFMGYVGGSEIVIVDEAVSLQRTNPELKLFPFSFGADTGLTFNVLQSPFDDVRVRHAIQMALDLETIGDTYFRGWADARPSGYQGIGRVGYNFPFEEWPEEIKQYYRYDPEGAEKLLDEAGYPRGADGVRFKTVYEHYENFDIDYYQIAMEYIRAIGIDVEVKVNDRATHMAAVRERKQLGLITERTNDDWIRALSKAHSKAGWNPASVNDPVYDATYEAYEAATTLEERKRLAIEADKYTIEQHWYIAGPRVPQFNVSQPWIMGYNGEIDGNLDRIQIFARLWIDHELKKEMGH